MDPQALVIVWLIVVVTDLLNWFDRQGYIPDHFHAGKVCNRLNRKSAIDLATHWEHDAEFRQKFMRPNP